MAMEDFAKQRKELTDQLEEAEATMDGAKMGELEKALADLDVKQKEFESKSENAGDPTESQLKQVKDLGGDPVVLSQKIEEGTQEKMKEVEESKEKIVEKVNNDQENSLIDVEAVKNQFGNDFYGHNFDSAIKSLQQLPEDQKNKIAQTVLAEYLRTGYMMQGGFERNQKAIDSLSGVVSPSTVEDAKAFSIYNSSNYSDIKSLENISTNLGISINDVVEKIRKGSELNQSKIIDNFSQDKKRWEDFYNEKIATTKDSSKIEKYNNSLKLKLKEVDDELKNRLESIRTSDVEKLQKIQEALKTKNS